MHKEYTYGSIIVYGFKKNIYVYITRHCSWNGTFKVLILNLKRITSSIISAVRLYCLHTHQFIIYARDWQTRQRPCTFNFTSSTISKLIREDKCWLLNILMGWYKFYDYLLESIDSIMIYNLLLPFYFSFIRYKIK